MNTRVTLLALSFLALSCTTVDYRSPRFTAQAGGHQTIAVLPFEMIFTGKAPAGLTAAQIQRIEEAESLAFQTSLYFRLLNRVGKGRIAIDVQQVEETNRILAGHGIGIRDSWAMTPQALADVLGVDAVVRTRVQKTRYISDLTSYGIDVGIHVLDQVTDGSWGWLLPHGLVKTHDIFADGSLLNGDDGELLWKVAVHRATDWSRPANDVIDGLTKKLAKKFPYRG